MQLGIVRFERVNVSTKVHYWRANCRCCHYLVVSELGQASMEIRTEAAIDAGLEAFAPEVDLPLDPGIREAVLILRSGGVETFESCEGGPGHAFPEPTIKFAGGSWAGYRAFAIAKEYGLRVLNLRRVYGVVDGQLEGPWWEMTFLTTGRD